MAIMIPKLTGDGVPEGETLVFSRLRDDPVTKDWIVLHSLGIADHVNQLQGETDFVVLAPGLGFAVVEVKSHQTVSRDKDGLWHLGKQKPTPRSPFKQASDNMFSWRRMLIAQRPQWSRVPFTWAVWFTGCTARNVLAASPEWHPWQVLDRGDLGTGAGAALQNMFRQARAELDHRYGLDLQNSQQPSRATMSSIATALRPQFDLRGTPKQEREDRQRELIRLAQDQADALAAVSGNDRVLVSGPAGTGKTVLAAHVARQKAATGVKGLLVCFNVNLARELTRQMSDAPNVQVATLHRLMLDLAQISPDGNPDFWTKTLPTAALAKLDAMDPAVGFLLVDEIQDLTHPGFLSVLDKLTPGNFEGGRVWFFGDYERQTIFGDQGGQQLLKDTVPGLATYQLTRNYRNQPRIAVTVENWTGMNPKYASYERQDDRVDVKIIKYVTPEEQHDRLLAALTQLTRSGFRLEDIVILSTKREGTAQTSTNSWLAGHRTDQMVNPKPNTVRAGTIHSFKGLEAPAVILTDLDETAPAELTPLLYVGLSRALDRLTVLITHTKLETIMTQLQSRTV